MLSVITEWVKSTRGNVLVELCHVQCVRWCDFRPELVAVMKCIGNELANSIWEGDMKGKSKPGPSSSR